MGKRSRMSHTIELYRTLKTILCKSYFWIKLFFFCWKKGMTCATSSFMLVSLTLLADAFLFVFCASYLLYVYSNIISVDNIIITNNKMIQFSVHQGSCQHIFSQGFWCTFVYSWDGSYSQLIGAFPHTNQVEKMGKCNARLNADMLNWAYHSHARSCTLSLVQPYS